MISLLPNAPQSVITMPYLKHYFKTNERPYKLNIKKDDILKIIRNLNVNKKHGHDDISITILKVCDSVLTEPQSIIFKNCINHGVFLNTWKMSHIIPIHEKNEKRSLNNCCPDSLLPIWGKIFEIIILKELRNRILRSICM